MSAAPVPKSPQVRDPAGVRRRVLDEGTRLFSARGMAGTSFRDVADAAGVSVSLIQHHFGTKESLYAAVKAHAVETHVRSQAPNLALPQGLSTGRVGGRLALLKTIEGQRRELDRYAEVEKFDRHRQQAVSLLNDPHVQRAFDVQRADPREQDRYGRNQFGWSLLMARRLVEAGVSLVQVNLGNNESWDTHVAAFPNLKNFLLPPTDRGVSALLDDLESSGRLASTLVVMAGEFGRTPRISGLGGGKLPGRDHWGAVQTVWLAGGGIKGGTVIGSSDRIGGYPAADPQTPENLAATIYQGLGIPREAHWRDPNDRPHFIYHADPIRGLS